MDGDFDSSWLVLSSAIKEIHRKDASRLSFEELYRTAYTLVIRKHGRRLYDSVKQEIRSHLRGVLNAILMPKHKRPTVLVPSTPAAPQPLAPSSDSTLIKPLSASTNAPDTLVNPALSEPNVELLTSLLTVWSDHCTCMRMISDILMYLDRVYSREAKVPLIYDAGLSIFRDVMFNSDIENDVYYTILGLLRKDRDGITADRSIIRSVVSMLEYLPDTSLMGNSIYIGRFEPLLFQDTEKYYEDAAGNLLLNNHNASIYIHKTKGWIQDEVERCSMYLLSSSLNRLQEGVQRVLISERFPEVLNYTETGFRQWVQSDQYGDIKLTYELYGMVTTAYEVVNEILKTCVVEWGSEINSQAKVSLQSAKQAKSGKNDKDDEGDAAKGKGKSAKSKTDSISPTTIAIQWVKKVLKLKDKFEQITTRSLCSNSSICANVDDSFSLFINKNTKVSEYLSLFIDDNLKKSLKGKSDSEIEETLEKSVVLFRFIADKDVFENYYKAHLAKRLLNSKSLSEDIEKNLISKLKMEIGTSYTSKLDGMFRDMKLSKEMMVKYKEKKQDASITENGTNTDNPLPVRKNNEVDISVNVLTSTFWPTSVVSTQMKCNFPPEIESARESFEKFYFSLHSGRKLSWNPNLGTADVKVRFNKRVHEINMPTLAMIILMQFTELSDETGLTFDQLAEATNIPKGELVRHLQSLAVAPRTRILRKVPMSKDVKPTDKFYFNSKFESNTTRFKVLTVASSNKLENDAEKSSTLAKVEQSRKLETDAAIVRIMKARKTLEHAVLVSEVVKQLAPRFKPEPQLIKSRIDNLLEREYLERDSEKRSIYNYLA